MLYRCFCSGRVARLHPASIHHSLEHDDASCVSDARCGLLHSLSAIGLLAVSACQIARARAGRRLRLRRRRHGRTRSRLSEPLRDEIPPAELSAVMAAHFKGLGSMEQYEYGAAVDAFREVHRRAPGWIPGAINLAIALLNDTGVQAEQAKKTGGKPLPTTSTRPSTCWPGSSSETPTNPYAHFCRGIILEQQGRLAEAHQHFKKVTEIDPNDAAAWYWSGSTLPDPDNPSQPAGPDQANEQIALYAKALELQSLPDARDLQDGHEPRGSRTTRRRPRRCSSSGRR